ncbi:hypothetical protein [Yunchengibacter salinarum]|uniref:hypothetical protein n=1 Tax=Yunchengibacter salinarum TaxID=3133399 RepID=UPI0035B6383D
MIWFMRAKARMACGLMLAAGLLATGFPAALMSSGAQAYDYRMAVRSINAQWQTSWEFRALRLAVQHAPGQHTVNLVEIDMPQDQLLDRLENLPASERDFNVFMSVFSQARQDRFAQVDFPVARGLLGYRLLVIREGEQSRFDGITDLDSYRSAVTTLSGTGWPDTDILKANDVPVETGVYKQLWKKLRAGQGDGFSRSPMEIESELAEGLGAGGSPTLTIERGLVLRYLNPLFVYMRKEDSEAAEDLLIGFYNAFESGRYERMFRGHPRTGGGMKLLEGSGRTVIRLKNPMINERIRNIPDFYWVDPDF